MLTLQKRSVCYTSDGAKLSRCQLMFLATYARGFFLLLPSLLLHLPVPPMPRCSLLDAVTFFMVRSLSGACARAFATMLLLPMRSFVPPLTARAGACLYAAMADVPHAADGRKLWCVICHHKAKEAAGNKNAR
jgi:hypothetical protein